MCLYCIKVKINNLAVFKEYLRVWDLLFNVVNNIAKRVGDRNETSNQSHALNIFYERYRKWLNVIRKKNANCLIVHNIFYEVEEIGTLQKKISSSLQRKFQCFRNEDHIVSDFPIRF